ncbi:hypothetical protein [Winogradskyella poriferorum]|uniref:hypothetical protein n=1 Tax=Winogradskyella poriferorum TaxID=307627 RepID=UPI003D64B8D8
MKIKLSLLMSICCLVIISCSSAKVLDSWKSEKVGDIKDNNLLVIVRSQDKSARIAFENEIVKQLAQKGIASTASFTKFPTLNPEKKLSEEKQKQIRSIIEAEGFNGVVLTALKDKEELVRTETDGGYYAGSTYYGYYPRYYGGFVRYYGHPLSYRTLGNYVEETTTTYTSTNYVLETLVFDLENEPENELVAVVTTLLEDPDDASEAATKYVKAISKAFQK